MRFLLVPKLRLGNAGLEALLRAGTWIQSGASSRAFPSRSLGTRRRTLSAFICGYFPMRNIKLVLSYDGTEFQGWQTQPGFRTVQETLEQAIAKLTGEERIRVNASGRTDAGVHALGQVVNFFTTTQHAPDVLVRALNAHLPSDVIVRAA